MLIVFMTLIVAVHTSAPVPDSANTALQFGKNPTSYILLPSDTAPISRSFSACGWVNRHSNHLDFYQFWISYGVRGSIQEFGISDSGPSYMFGDGILPRYQRLTVEEYHHICFTWGESRVVLYYDGVEIGREETPGDRELITPGTLILGQFVSYSGVENIEKYRYFGGELTDVNIFTRQLTAGQVGEMYRQGICSTYTKRYREDIFISWQGILQMERFGDVREVELRCPGQIQQSEESEKSEESEESEKSEESEDPEESEKSEESVTSGGKSAERGEVENQDSRSVWDFLYGERFYEELITRNLIGEIHRHVDLLTDFIGHKIDKNLINHVKKHHD